MVFLFLGLLFDFNGTMWNLFVAWLSARAATAIRQTRDLHRWVERALGSLFIYLGIRLAVAER
jgi:threonine/homoserine/homoserine lactone efflux protein